MPLRLRLFQVGRTTDNQLNRRAYFEPGEIIQATREKLAQTEAFGVHVDALTIVPDGEPTLDVNIGKTIQALRGFGIRIAVISNASIIWQADVRADLARADWVSLKIDSALPHYWRRINRPNNQLHLSNIFEGIRAFADEFTAKLVTETMLVNGINDNDESLESVASRYPDSDLVQEYLSKCPLVKTIYLFPDDKQPIAWIFDTRSLKGNVRETIETH